MVVFYSSFSLNVDVIQTQTAMNLHEMESHKYADVPLSFCIQQKTDR